MADFHLDAKRRGIDIIAAESFVDNPAAQVENIKVIMINYFCHLKLCVFVRNDIFHQYAFYICYIMWTRMIQNNVSAVILKPLYTIGILEKLTF